jgi:REP element-mobilizing transposase RayT
MTRARATLVSVEQTPYYHCVGRCVRRAFLCGADPVSGRNFEHRRDWLRERLAELVEVFAIDLCAYALMSNHYHLVVQLRPDAPQQWPAEEVVQRWTRLFTGPDVARQFLHAETLDSAERARLDTLVATWRERLGNLSWFMRCLNEYIARRANAEDGCTGHFWEGRFKTQALLDDAALVTAMVYVDLNPVRAGTAADPSHSDYTSAQDRIRTVTQPAPTTAGVSPTLLSFAGAARDGAPFGLPFNLQDYLALLDDTGRVIRQDKPGFIDGGTPRLLAQLGVAPNEWLITVTALQARYELAMGAPERLRRLAAAWATRWICGIRFARRLYPAAAG